MLNNFFNPKSVAVIGASADKNKVGYALMANLTAKTPKLNIGEGNSSPRFNLGDTRTCKIFPISISEKEILGIPAFASIEKIPVDEIIDLAIIAVRSDVVPQILEECGIRGIKCVTIISAGFREVGEEGKILEGKLKTIADKYGIALLGPNCLGTIDLHTDFNGSFGSEKPEKGGIAFLSQSGALGSSILDLAVKEGVGFSKFISLGNEAQLSEIEFLEFLAKDDDTKAILIYLEKLSNGKRFMEITKEISKTKPIVVLKAGRSKRGMRAVMSHTGSLAPDDAVFSEALAQSGVIAVESIREFFNMAKLFQLGIMKSKKNIVILTNGGGPSVVAADLVDLSRSLSMVELNSDTKDALRKVLPSMAAVGNPIDIIGDALSARYESALKILAAEKDVDAIILILTPQMMTEVEATAKLVHEYCGEGDGKKSIIPVFIGGPSIETGLKYFRSNGLVNFGFPKDIVEALDNLALGALKENVSKKSASNDSNDSRDRTTSKMLNFSDMTRMLSDYDISFGGILVKDRSSLASSVAKLGNGPFAMKVISADIVHKTDAGAVCLNIKDLEGAVAAWDMMKKKILNAKPNAQIEGILIQKMSVGREVIIGMKRDATFGPTILFGLGGIMAEALKDTALRIAPLWKNEAEKMMQEIKGSKILNGMRGEGPVDFELLTDVLVNLSRLAMEHPEIQEIDLNPVIVTGDSVSVVDARMMV